MNTKSKFFDFKAKEPQGWVRLKITLTRIIEFGIYLESVYTQYNNFKEFRKVGYIKTHLREYKTDKYYISDLKNVIDYSLKEKKVVTAVKNNKIVEGFEWSFIPKNQPKNF